MKVFERCVVFALLIVLLVPHSACAATDRILINEVNAYWDHMAAVKYPEDHIDYSAIDIFGDFSLYYSPLPESKYFGMHFFYVIIDANNVSMTLRIQRFPFERSSEPDILTELPNGAQSMRELPFGFELDSDRMDYARNGLTYQYGCIGEFARLSAISWQEDGFYYLVGCNTPLTYQYPETGEQTIFMRLLSIDDDVAMEAWDELKTHIRENNKKPIDWKPVMIGTGVAVLVVGVGVPVGITAYKKRKKACNVTDIANIE